MEPRHGDRTTIPILDPDILVLIMALLPQQSLSMLMRTNRSLHRDNSAIRLLLREVNLCSSRAVKSFSLFTEARDHRENCYTLINSFHFSVPTATQEDVEPFLKVLERAKSLWSLQIGTGFYYETFVVNEQIGSAMRADLLPTLSELYFKAPVDSTTLQRIADSFRGQLKTLEVGVIHNGGSSISVSRNTIPVLLSSIDELRVASRTLPYSLELLAFPNLRRIHIQDSSPWYECFPQLRSSFPSLQELIIEGTWDFLPRNAEPDYALSSSVTPQLVVALNKATRDQNKTHSAAHPLIQQCLRRVEANLCTMYSLGLESHIQELELRSTVRNELVTELTTVITETSPATVRMTFEVTALDELDDLVPAFAGSSVEHLDIRICYSNTEWAVIDVLVSSHHSKPPLLSPDIDPEFLTIKSRTHFLQGFITRNFVVSGSQHPFYR